MEAASRFYATASFGQLTISYVKTPWLHALSGAPACLAPADVLALPTMLAHATESSGYDVASYDRLIFVLPQGNCAFVGIYNPGGITLNGTINEALVIHELGHSLGMGHANAFACTYNPHRFCRAVTYGDVWDAMGGSGDASGQFDEPVGDFGAIQKARAGWLTSYSCLTKPGTYQLASIEQAGSTSQALVVQIGPFQYWIDHREPIGNDTYLKTSTWGDVTTGFEVHRVSGDPLAAAPGSATPDYLIPTGRHNLYYTPPGATFTVANTFAATALSHKNGAMTIRLRWLGRTTPTNCNLERPG